MKQLLEQYRDMVKERKDIAQRIRDAQKNLDRIKKHYQIQDNVTGGVGGQQHFSVQGYHPEYKKRHTLMMQYKLRMEQLEIELEEKLETVERYIVGIEDSRKRMIMRYHYIDGYTWRETAAKIGAGNDGDAVRMEIKRFLRKQ